MVKSNWFSVSGVLLVFFCLNTAAESPALHVVTEEFAPCNYRSKDKLEGVATRLVRRIFEQSGHSITIKDYPWKRAYYHATKDRNIAIYSMGRTPERESLFRWVGPVCPFEAYFIKRKNRDDIVIKKLEDAKNFYTATGLDGLLAHYLEKEGFVEGEHFEGSSDYGANITKLAYNRVDLVTYDRLAFFFKARKMGYSPDLFEVVYLLEEVSSPLYLAFSKKTEDKLYQSVLSSYKKLKEDGTLARIQEDYLADLMYRP